MPIKPWKPIFFYTRTKFMLGTSFFVQTRVGPLVNFNCCWFMCLFLRSPGFECTLQYSNNGEISTYVCYWKSLKWCIFAFYIVPSFATSIYSLIIEVWLKWNKIFFWLLWWNLLSITISLGVNVTWSQCGAGVKILWDDTFVMIIENKKKDLAGSLFVLDLHYQTNNTAHKVWWFYTKPSTITTTYCS